MSRKERHIERRAAGRPGLAIDLRNLTGHLTLEPSPSGDVELTALVVAEADDEVQADRLARAVDVPLDPQGELLVVRAVYPDVATLRYPLAELARGAFGERGDIGVSVPYAGSVVTVTSREDSGAPVLYADITLRVPAGAVVQGWNGVGNVEAGKVDAVLELSSECGDVAVQGGSGDTRVLTRTGDTLVLERSGEIEVRSPAGDVAVVASSGRIAVETGSGGIALDRLKGEVRAASGSGDVQARDISPRGFLYLASGSGDVRLEAPGLLPVKQEEGLLLGTLEEAEVRLSSKSGLVRT